MFDDSITIKCGLNYIDWLGATFQYEALVEYQLLPLGVARESATLEWNIMGP